MKTLGTSAVVGVLLALIVIYLLQPLNSGAVALVVTICVGLAALGGQILSWLFKSGTDKSKGGQEND